MKHGKNIPYFLELAEEGAPPAPLLQQPVMGDAEALMFRAFLDLHACRGEGFSGSNPITAADIHAYWSLFPACPPRRFFALVKSLDTVFLEWQRENSPTP